MSQTVTVYTKPNCAQCDMTKRWLNSKGVEYQVEDALEDANLEAIKFLGYLAAPVIIVSQGELQKDVHWAGFRPDKLQEHVNH